MATKWGWRYTEIGMRWLILVLLGCCSSGPHSRYGKHARELFSVSLLRVTLFRVRPLPLRFFLQDRFLWHVERSAECAVEVFELVRPFASGVQICNGFCLGRRLHCCLAF